jgi:SAM-dependent methyltransferase
MNFDDFAGDYDNLLRENIGLYGKDTSYYVKYKVEVMKRCAENKTPLSILDFGCGVGKSIPFLQRFFPGSAIWGCDPSKESLSVAQRDNPTCSFFSVKEIPLERFDLILVSCVFHHVPPISRDKILSVIKLLMSPGAELFVFEHNPYNPLTRHAVNTCPFDKDAELITSSDMKKLVFRSGLTLLSSRYTLFFPAALKSLRILEPLLRWMPLGGQYMIHARRNVGRAG